MTALLSYCVLLNALLHDCHVIHVTVVNIHKQIKVILQGVLWGNQGYDLDMCAHQNETLGLDFRLACE